MWSRQESRPPAPYALHRFHASLTPVPCPLLPVASVITLFLQGARDGWKGGPVWDLAMQAQSLRERTLLPLTAPPPNISLPPLPTTKAEEGTQRIISCQAARCGHLRPPINKSPSA